MGDRERLVLSRDFRLGDLLRGTTPSIAVSKSICFAGDRRLGERRRVFSSIAWEMSTPEAIISHECGTEKLKLSEKYIMARLLRLVGFSLVLIDEKRW
jgi:hypothetical protein